MILFIILKALPSGRGHYHFSGYFPQFSFGTSPCSHYRTYSVQTAHSPKSQSVQDTADLTLTD